MKRIAPLLLLLSAVFFVKCNNNPVEEPVKPVPEGKNNLSLQIIVPKSNISTYAGVDATTLENHIDTLYVNLYQGASLTPINQSKFFGANLEVLMNNNDSIVKVAYEVDNITTGTLRAEVFANSRTVRVLGVTDSVPLPRGNAATSFFMSGKGEFQYTSGVYTATIALQRNVAKVRVNVSKHSIILPSDLEIVYDKVVIKTINIANQTSLFGPTTDAATAFATTEPRTGSFLHKSPSFSTASGGQIDSFYVYENIRSNYDLNYNTTKIEVSITTTSPTTGTKEDTYTYPLFTKNSYDILRNYIYTLDIKVRGQSLEPVITTSIQPWNDVNIDGTVHGTYLTMDKSEIVFNSNGEATINFCSDAQAVYFDYTEFHQANPVQIGYEIYPIGIENADQNLAPNGFKDGQILLDKQHCGSFGFKLDLDEFPEFPNVNFSGKICVRAGNIVKCLSFPGVRTYDAHFIVGDYIFDPNEKYTSATVYEDSNNNDSPGWLNISENRLYTSGGMLTSFGPNANPAKELYLHLNENLTGKTRSGSVTVISDDGTNSFEKTIHIAQLPALRIGRFGYNAGTTTDASIYTADLYTEQLYEYSTMPRYFNLSPNDDGRITPDNALYNGRMTAIGSAFIWTNYQNFDYQNTIFQAINYCAHKNRITNNTSASTDLKWYLPAQAQLMGMWIAYHGIDSTSANFYRMKNGVKERADVFWSSTDNNGYPTEAQYLNFKYGNVGHYQRAIPYWARCVRDVTPSGSLPGTSSMVDNNNPGVNEFPTIDFSRGMPANSYSTDTKSIATHEGSSRDKTLYQKLRVAKYDYVHPDGTILTPNLINGLHIFDCGANYSENGEFGDWRLPTQRELQAIWVLQDEIKSKCNTFEYLANDYYWTSTYASTSWDSNMGNGAGGYTNAWTIYGGRTPPGDAGNAPHQLRSTPLRIRCVKEL